MRVDLRMQNKTYTFADTSEGQYFLCKGNLYLCCSPYELNKQIGLTYNDEYAYCFNTEEFVHMNFDEPIIPIDPKQILIKVEDLK
jgi:hypothetical protein